MSGFICAIYPLFAQAGLVIAIAVLGIWGIAVIADSAQFSAVAARVCPPELVGSALAIQNSVGFFITVLSITLITSLVESLGSNVSWLLLPDPIVGLYFLRPLLGISPDQLKPST